MIDDFRPAPRPPKPAPTKFDETKTPHVAEEPTVPFQTPDQISQHEQPGPIEPLAAPAPGETPIHHGKPPRGTGHHWFNLPWPPNRVEVMSMAAVLVLAIGGTISYLALHRTEATPVVTSTTHKKMAVVAKPTTVPSTLSGLDVAPEVNQRPVIGAMIENSLDARPQSGLSQAGVVFEALAEGGVTRFLALFQDQQPTNIGPVRSARPYYVQWAMGFHAAYAHVGGSPDALADIKAWGVQDLNQFYNAAPYHRISSRPSPHNVYASVVDLANLATQKSFSSTYQGFARKKAAASKAPTATAIDLSLSSSTYNVHYAYDAATNSYDRFEGGAAQTDANTGSQLTPSVVVALVVPLSAGTKDAQGSAYSNYNPIGDGVAYVFQDGIVTSGSWHKASNDAPLSFTDANGAALKLNPGQTWITAISASSKVSYK